MNFSRSELKLLNIKYVNKFLWIGIISIGCLFVFIPFGIYNYQKIDKIWESNGKLYDNLNRNSNNFEKDLIEGLKSQNKIIREAMQKLNYEKIIEIASICLFLGAVGIG